jgi:hypothetical protein
LGVVIARIETILTHLRRGNIVRSERGPGGGFWLARPAAEISLAEVIRAIDGQILDQDGERAGTATYPGPAEPLRRVWIALRAFGLSSWRPSPSPTSSPASSGYLAVVVAQAEHHSAVS